MLKRRLRRLRHAQRLPVSQTRLLDLAQPLLPLDCSRRTPPSFALAYFRPSTSILRAIRATSTLSRPTFLRLVSSPLRRSIMSLTADLPHTPIATDPSLTFQLLSTAHFAAVAHSQQRRKSPSSPAYVQHPLHVAALLASPASSLHPNPPIEVLQAAMLHDVIEDTETTVQELRERFGDVVTNIGASSES